MKNFRIVYVALLVGIVIPFSVVLTYKHITQPDWYGWPAVTKCRLCEKTIWEWQDYERRDYNVKVGGGTFGFGVGASGIVHSDCKGTPDFEISFDTE